ncbi:MAG: hypothetical protein K2K44_10455 [Oscillospiraceae bacterium]|nr:hypothetical protein [Oscillospiraceae bacterium]
MSAISPIGVGISNSMAGFGGASYGMAVYRKNAWDNTPALVPNPISDTPVSGTELRNAPPEQKNAPNGVQQNGKLSKEADWKRRFDSFECQTCKNRKYQDGSDDSGVSFQTPTRVDPKSAGAAVRSHEQEHVSRNRSKAKREGREIVSQSVTIHTNICPECGRVYVSGGTTRTATRNASENKLADKYNVGKSDPTYDNGKVLNTAA